MIDIIRSFRTCFIAIIVILTVVFVTSSNSHADPSHDDQGRHAVDPPTTNHLSDSTESRYVPGAYPEPFGFDLTTDWLAPWPHSHFSRRGTPFVHTFFLEPAFLDRDLFFDYRVTRGADEDEQELEVELEWALTQRIGLVVEVPMAQVNPDTGATEDGFGDLALGARFLLVDTDRFLMSGNLEISFPTGDEDRGLGSGEVGLSPSLSMWFDLDHWVTLSTQVGTEHGVESGDSEFFYRAALIYTFLTPALFESQTALTNRSGNHSPGGMTNLIAEMAGRTILHGEDDGRSTLELLLGVSYALTGHWEIRGGYQFPLGKPKDIDDGVIFGLIYHF